MKRKNNAIKPLPSYAFVVDGACESWYLNMLKRNETSIRLNMEPQIPQNKALKDQITLVKAKARDYTRVFWIVDFDTVLKENKEARERSVSPLHQFLNFRRNAPKNVTIIINNPCLELWLLLHYSNTSRLFNNCQDVQKELKKYLPDYEKTQAYYTRQGNDIYLRLKPKLNEAMENARLLGALDFDNPEKTLSELFLLFNILGIHP